VLTLQLIEKRGDDAQHLGAQFLKVRRSFGRTKVAHRHPTQAVMLRGIQVDCVGAHAITVPHNIEEDRTQAFRALCRPLADCRGEALDR
jgi:hypothetical protein